MSASLSGEWWRISVKVKREADDHSSKARSSSDLTSRFPRRVVHLSTLQKKNNFNFIFCVNVKKILILKSV